MYKKKRRTQRVVTLQRKGKRKTVLGHDLGEKIEKKLIAYFADSDVIVEVEELVWFQNIKMTREEVERERSWQKYIEEGGIPY